MNELIQAATNTFGGNPKDNSRKRESVWCRFALWSILYGNHYSSLKSLGKEFNRDHSSVLHGLRQHENLMAFDRDYQRLYDKFLSIIPKGYVKDISTRAKIYRLLDGLDSAQMLQAYSEIAKLKIAS